MQKYSQLINKELIEFEAVTGKNKNEFVGIRVTSDRVVIHYPESFSLTFDSQMILRNEILSLISSIQLGKSNNQYFDLEDKLNDYDANPISSMLWILKDYLLNGLYRNTESVYKNNMKGKINWKRTISNTASKSTTLPLSDSIISENKISISNIVADLHFEALRIASKNLGWLFSLDSRIFATIRINQLQIKQYIYLIDIEIHRTFNDTQRVRLVNIRKILEWMEYKSGGSFSYGTNHFHLVFETLVDRVFGNVSEKKYNPKAKWYLTSENSFNTNTLRPDTVYTQESKVVIIDSKYYRFGTTSNHSDLPNVDSIQKQSTYLEYFKTKFPYFEDVKIAFFMPYNKKSDQEESLNIKYIGYAISDWKSNSDLASEYFIHTYLIDLKFLLNTWKSGNYSDIRSEFYKTIFNEYTS